MKIWDFDSMSADDLVSFANQVTTVLGKRVLKPYCNIFDSDYNENSKSYLSSFNIFSSFQSWRCCVLRLAAGFLLTLA